MPSYPTPISIGQARNEMQQGNPINAGNGPVCQLAGVSPGQRYAWSYWYGKRRAPDPINVLLVTIRVTVDRNMWVYFNPTFGSINWVTDGDGRTRMQSYTYYQPPLSQLYDGYTSSEIYVGAVRPLSAGGYYDENGGFYESYYRGLSDGFYPQQQASPANGWAASMYINDNGGYSSGGNEIDVWFRAS